MRLLSIRPLRHVTLLLSLWMLLCGCASHEIKKNTVWHSRDQYVAVTDQDMAGAPVNRQPVALSRKSLRTELASLKVKAPSEKQKQVSLFGEQELRVLTEELYGALQQAGPAQDVVFAVSGSEPVLRGFGSVEVVTTGRVFYQDGRLNLILGMVREAVRESDRRLQPFVPGSRTKVSALPALASASPNVAFAANRPDWLVVKVAEEDKNAKEDAAPQEAEVPAVEEPARRAPGKGAAAPAIPAKSIEERLRVLGELRAKGLITEEEYRQKKESILREL